MVTSAGWPGFCLGRQTPAKEDERDPAREKRLFCRRRSCQAFLPSREMWPQGRAVTLVGEDRRARRPGVHTTCQGVASGAPTRTASPAVSFRQSTVPAPRVCRGRRRPWWGLVTQQGFVGELCGATPQTSVWGTHTSAQWVKPGSLGSGGRGESSDTLLGPAPWHRCRRSGDGDSRHGACVCGWECLGAQRVWQCCRSGRWEWPCPQPRGRPGARGGPRQAPRTLPAPARRFPVWESCARLSRTDRPLRAAPDSADT